MVFCFTWLLWAARWREPANKVQPIMADFIPYQRPRHEKTPPFCRGVLPLFGSFRPATVCGIADQFVDRTLAWPFQPEWSNMAALRRSIHVRGKGCAHDRRPTRQGLSFPLICL